MAEVAEASAEAAEAVAGAVVAAGAEVVAEASRSRRSGFPQMSSSPRPARGAEVQAEATAEGEEATMGRRMVAPI